MVLLPILYSHLGMGGRPPALLSRLPLDNSDDDNDGCNDNYDNHFDENYDKNYQKNIQIS